MLPWLSSGRIKKIAVVGDVILDEYLDGEVSRISPEAPVPIVLLKKKSFSAGGAANAARNVQLAGAQAYLFSVCGKDDAAHRLREILSGDEIDLRGLLENESRPTIKKSRIIAGNQQMLRVDWERVQPIDLSDQELLLESLDSENFDAILISDYGKGALSSLFLSKIISIAKSKNIPTVVDPKGRNFSRYRGCDLITPNRKEACLALGIEEHCDLSSEELGRKLVEDLSLKNVLITLGKGGMVLVSNQKSKPAMHVNSVAREVYDVSGAGDTVAALMCLCFASNPLITQDAVTIANLGAGLVVEKWGTQPVIRHELEKALKEKNNRSETGSSQSKILPLEHLLAQVSEYKKNFKKIVFTNGCFDLLHLGHLSYLEKAKALGDVLIVAINDDSSVRRLKGLTRPYMDTQSRMKILAGLSCVSHVTEFSDQTPLRLIQCVKPHVLVKGADYQLDEIVGAKFVESYGGCVKTIEYLDGFSTSKIIDKIQESLDQKR